MKIWPQISNHRQSIISFLFSIPIGLLGGLIGLGGAEFRLPVLAGPLKFKAKEAISINLAVSLITLISSLIFRLNKLSSFPFFELLPVLMSFILGGLVAAFLSSGITSNLSAHSLERWIKILLISIGCLLLIESFMPDVSAHLLLHPVGYQLMMGGMIGLLIGVVSVSLGVAGGELIIPALIFIFGVGIKAAGTASLMISLPTVSMGLYRYYRKNMLFDRSTLLNIVTPMGAGSIIGSYLGGALVGIVSVFWLKIFLGFVLIASAIRMFMKNDQNTSV